jgi:hypothetical protein
MGTETGEEGTGSSDFTKPDFGSLTGGSHMWWVPLVSDPKSGKVREHNVRGSGSGEEGLVRVGHTQSGWEHGERVSTGARATGRWAAQNEIEMRPTRAIARYHQISRHMYHQLFKEQ